MPNKFRNASPSLIQKPSPGFEKISHRETESYMVARGAWWLSATLAFIFFIYYLTLNQLEVRGLFPQQVLTSGWFGSLSQPVNFAISGLLFLSALIFFSTRQGMSFKTKFLVGLFSGSAVAITYFMISQLNWSTILPSAVVVAFIFLSLGILTMVIKLLDEGVFNFYKLRAADIPIGMYGWEGADRWDILLGIAGMALPLLASIILSQAVIVPPSILVAGSVSPLFAAVFGMAVVRFENSIFLAFLQKTLASWVVYFMKAGRLNTPSVKDMQEAMWIRVAAGLVALVPVFFIVTAFHSGLYSGLGVTLFSTSMAFVIWGAITAYRGNTLAADIGHMGYNFLIGLLATGTAGAIALI